METDFRTELEHMLLQLAACKLDYETWVNWWNSNLDAILAVLSRGDELRINPELGSPYEWGCLLFSQQGAKRYLEKFGIPYTDSDRYEVESRNAETARREALVQALMAEHRDRTEAHIQRWEDYKERHGLNQTKPLFDVDTVLGYTAVDPQGKTNQSDLQKLSLKSLMKRKIAPIARAYGMRRITPNTFVRERDGVVTRIKFQGYFRGGGYDHMLINIFPAYMPSIFDFNYGMVSQDLIYTERYHEMKANWHYIEGSRWSRRYVKNELEESLQFDRIARFLAQDLLPAFDQVPSLGVFFAPERIAWVDAARVGPPVLPGASKAFLKGIWHFPKPQPARPKFMWETSKNEMYSSADDYVFGVWALLNGRWEEGYRLLRQSLVNEERDVATQMKVHHKMPDLSDYKRNHNFIRFRFAHAFIETQEIADEEDRRQAVQQAYKSVCGELHNHYHLF